MTNTTTPAELLADLLEAAHEVSRLFCAPRSCPSDRIGGDAIDQQQIAAMCEDARLGYGRRAIPIGGRAKRTSQTVARCDRIVRSHKEPLMPAEQTGMTIDQAIDALNNAAKRQTAETDAAKNVSEAKTRLVLSKDAKSAFFATLALRLEYQPDWSIDTAATDGRRLNYNPDFFNALTREERIGLLAHEVLHCAMKHFARRGGRYANAWNIACDLAINPLIVEAGMTLPKNGLHPGRKPFEDLPAGLSAEEYFARLPVDEETEKGDDPGGCGGVMDAENPEGTPATMKQLEAEWSVNVAAAAQAAKRRGELSAGLARFIGEALAPVVDWRAVLREFITRHARRNYNWKRPNRRHIHAGLYLPSLHSLELGSIVIAVDTSGSIGQAELLRFAGEINDIAAQGASTVTVIYHDSEVCHEQTWTPEDGPLVLEPHGGGGTDHRPVFARIEEAPEPPACVVLLTDLASTFPTNSPAYPVLWASTDRHARHPFGERVEIGV